MTINLQPGEVVLFEGRVHSASRDYLVVGAGPELRLYRRFEHDRRWHLENTVRAAADDWPKVLHNHVWGEPGLDYVPADSQRPTWLAPASPARQIKSRREIKDLQQEFRRALAELAELEGEAFRAMVPPDELIELFEDGALSQAKGLLEKGLKPDVAQKGKGRELARLADQVSGLLGEVPGCLEGDFSRWIGRIERISAALRLGDDLRDGATA